MRVDYGQVLASGKLQTLGKKYVILFTAGVEWRVHMPVTLIRVNDVSMEIESVCLGGSRISHWGVPT